MKRPFSLTMAVLAAAFTCYAADGARLATPKVAPLSGWRDLQAPHQIWPYDGAIYYDFDLDGGSRAHLIVVNTRNGRWTFKPAIMQSNTAPTSEIATKESASAAINGGYFNLKDSGDSAGFVTIGCAVVADPNNNKLLVENAKLKPFLPQIFNRTEVRILDDGTGKNLVQIAKHNAAVPAGTRLMHALQAGPRLLPTIEAKEEAFIRTEADGTVTDAINSKKPAARTAFGITPDGYAMMLAIAGSGQDPESSGATLEQVAALLKRLGCSEAVNFDGGASTTMFVRLGTPGSGKEQVPAGTVVCGKTPETRVKSVLLLLPPQKK